MPRGHTRDFPFDPNGDKGPFLTPGVPPRPPPAKPPDDDAPFVPLRASSLHHGWCCPNPFAERAKLSQQWLASLKGPSIQVLSWRFKKMTSYRSSTVPARIIQIDSRGFDLRPLGHCSVDGREMPGTCGRSLLAGCSWLLLAATG